MRTHAPQTQHRHTLTNPKHTPPRIPWAHVLLRPDTRAHTSQPVGTCPSEPKRCTHPSETQTSTRAGPTRAYNTHSPRGSTSARSADPARERTRLENKHGPTTLRPKMRTRPLTQHGAVRRTRHTHIRLGSNPDTRSSDPTWAYVRQNQHGPAAFTPKGPHHPRRHAGP